MPPQEPVDLVDDQVQTTMQKMTQMQMQMQENKTLQQTQGQGQHVLTPVPAPFPPTFNRHPAAAGAWSGGAAPQAVAPTSSRGSSPSG